MYSAYERMHTHTCSCSFSYVGILRYRNKQNKQRARKKYTPTTTTTTPTTKTIIHRIFQRNCSFYFLDFVCAIVFQSILSFRLFVLSPSHPHSALCYKEGNGISLHLVVNSFFCTEYFPTCFISSCKSMFRIIFLFLQHQIYSREHRISKCCVKSILHMLFCQGLYGDCFLFIFKMCTTNYLHCSIDIPQCAFHRNGFGIYLCWLEKNR